MIFLHGAGSNSDFWHRQRPAFPTAHYPNLPGHSSKQSAVRSRQSAGAPEPLLPTADRLPPTELPASPTGLHSIEDYADWLEAYVQDHSLSNVVLNGHSMGGAIALTLALRRPPWLRALVLTATGARLRVLPRLLDLLRTDYPAAVDLIISLNFAPPPSGELTYAQRALHNGVKRQILRTPQQVTLQDYEACDRFDVLPRLPSLTLPTLCIVGAEDQMTPPHYSRYLHEHVPASRLEIIEGAGHMLPLEQPEEYNRRLADFLAHV